ncbi:MAG: hypothetical protein WCA44_15200 [Acidobacteriaceae bacterium]
MAFELSDKVRAFAEHEYVAPARREGRKRFSIQVRDVWNSLVEREGFPRQNVPQVCNALRSRKFLKPLGLEIEKVEGPPSQTSTTVVFHYRFHRAEPESMVGKTASAPTVKEDARAAVASLRGLLRQELARYGGGEAFLRWLRTDPEKDRR